MMRLGILGSTRGTNLVPILQAISDKRLSADVAVVISNKEQALILEKARKAHIPFFYVDPTGLSRDEYDVALSTVLSQHRVDYVVLIGYMRILSSAFVNAWHNRVINIHPSLLPKHAGLMDLAVHQHVLDNHEQETGCTVHYVVEEVDAGPILLQKTCPVLSGDTAEILRSRVQTIEGDALVEALLRLHHH